MFAPWKKTQEFRLRGSLPLGVVRWEVAVRWEGGRLWVVQELPRDRAGVGGRGDSLPAPLLVTAPSRNEKFTGIKRISKWKNIETHRSKIEINFDLRKKNSCLSLKKIDKREVPARDNTTKNSLHAWRRQACTMLLVVNKLTVHLKYKALALYLVQNFKTLRGGFAFFGCVGVVAACVKNHDFLGENKTQNILRRLAIWYLIKIHRFINKLIFIFQGVHKKIHFKMIAFKISRTLGGALYLREWGFVGGCFYFEGVINMDFFMDDWT